MKWAYTVGRPQPLPSRPTALDNYRKALGEIDNPVIDLDPNQTVCGDCRLVYWAPVGACTNCPQE